MDPNYPVSTGITCALTFHMCWIYIIWSLYFKIFSGSFLIAFLSPEIATYINNHVPCLLSWIITSSLMLGTGHVGLHLFHSMVTLTSWLVLTDFGRWSYQCLSNFTPTFLHMLNCSWTYSITSLYILFLWQ
jgi:hypothetical protein